jgi:hypothetical protein
MSQVIDEIEKISAPKKTFSKLSFIISIVTVLLYVSAYRLRLSEESDFFKPSSNEFIYAIFTELMSIIVGFIVAIISFIKKEPSTIIKWIGGVLNLGFFIFLILYL